MIGSCLAGPGPSGATATSIATSPGAQSRRPARGIAGSSSFMRARPEPLNEQAGRPGRLRSAAWSDSDGPTAVLEVDDRSCFTGLNRGDCPLSVEGVHALYSLVEAKKGVVLHLAGVELDRCDVVGRQHATIEHELYPVQQSVGPSCGTLAFGEGARPRGLPRDDQERARLLDEAKLLLDLAADCGTRGLVGLRDTARNAPRGWLRRWSSPGATGPRCRRTPHRALPASPAAARAGAGSVPLHGSPSRRYRSRFCWFDRGRSRPDCGAHARRVGGFGRCPGLVRESGGP